MAKTDLEITIRAKDEFSGTFAKAGESAAAAAGMVRENFEDLGLAQDKLASGVEKVEGRYRRFGEAARELSAAVGELGQSFEKAASAGASQGEGNDGPGFFGLFKFNGDEVDEFRAARREYFESSLQWAEELTGKKIALAEKEFTALSGYDELFKHSAQSRKDVVNKSYSAMETQLLSLVETHRFSAGEFAKAVAQQVKIELTGLAARAAIWAIFEAAMGLKDLAVGNPAAALHFKSAAEFGLVSGAALAAAAGVQSLFLGGKAGQGSGAAGGGANALSTPAPPPAGLSQGQEETRPTQQITININNPLSEQNWQEIAENNIAPALKDLKDRNVEISFNV